MGLTPYEREQMRLKAVAETERNERIARNAPAWAAYRAELELKALLNEVVSSDQVTDEHKAAYGRLSASLAGGQ